MCSSELWMTSMSLQSDLSKVKEHTVNQRQLNDKSTVGQ